MKTLLFIATVISNNAPHPQPATNDKAERQRMIQEIEAYLEQLRSDIDIELPGCPDLSLIYNMECV